MGVYDYHQLDVWKKGMEICQKAYIVTHPFPKEEIYGLTAQIRRAASSIPANIAEGFGRKSNNDFKRFLKIATGSLLELETHIEIACRLNYCRSDEAANLFEETNSLGKMLNRFVHNMR